MTRHDVLTPRKRKSVYAIAWVSVIATVIAWLYGAAMSEPVPIDTDSYGTGPLGHRALVETLRELDIHVVRERDGHRAVTAQALLFIEPTRFEATEEGWTHHLDELLQERQRTGRASVVVLPKWRMVGEQAVLMPAGEVAAVLALASGADGTVRRTGNPNGASAPHLTRGSLGGKRIEVPYVQTVERSLCGEVLADVDEGALVLRCGATIVVTDPDILHNFNLHRGDNAALATALIRDGLGTDAVVVDEAFHDHGAKAGLGAALGRFPVVLVPVHMLLLGTLLVLAAMRRFGSPRRARNPFERGPSRVIEVTAGILASGSKPSALVLDYTRHLLHDTSGPLRGELDEDDERAAERLDRIAQRFGIEPLAMQSLTRAREAAESSGRGGEARAVGVARQLWRLRRSVRRALTGEP